MPFTPRAPVNAALGKLAARRAAAAPMVKPMPTRGAATVAAPAPAFKKGGKVKKKGKK
jgi:hypothetical protein